MLDRGRRAPAPAIVNRTSIETVKSRSVGTRRPHLQLRRVGHATRKESRPK